MKLNNNPRVFWSIIIIVMAFNIAVVGSLVYFFVSHRVVFEKIDHEELRAKIDEIKDLRPDIHSKYRNNIRPLNDKNRELRIKFLKELIKPEPQYDSLLVLSEKIQEITLDISMNFYKEMIEMRKVLSTEEAVRFYGHQLKMMERRFRGPADGVDIGHENGERRFRGPQDEGDSDMRPQNSDRRERGKQRELKVPR